MAMCCRSDWSHQGWCSDTISEDILQSLSEDGELTTDPVIAKESDNDLQPSGSIPKDGTPLETQDLMVRKSKRGNIPRRFFEIEGENFLCTPIDEEEPASYKEALSSLASKEWMTTMQDEISSMDKNKVWELDDLSPGCKNIGNKWVLKIKCKADGSIDKYKACLVAKGYTQSEGIDYDDTLTPVVRFASIRLILAIVAQKDLNLFQMDVKTAFLNGDLDTTTKSEKDDQKNTTV
ncbi:unnamed protein product [Prunus armeniaca]